MLTSEDLYESMHWRELDLRDKLDSRLQLPLTLGTSMVGVLAFLLSNVDNRHATGSVDYVFFLLLALTFLSLAGGAYFFFRSSSGSFSHRNTYKNIPVSRELDEYQQGWEKYLKAHPPATNGLTAADQTKALLIRRYMHCQEINADINDFRALNIVRLQLSIVVATVLGALTFALFFFGGLGKSDHPTPQDVKIISPVTVQGAPGSEPIARIEWLPVWPPQYFHLQGVQCAPPATQKQQKPGHAKHH
jgi:hypothetical protein